jgi:hypothetical protein
LPLEVPQAALQTKSTQQFAVENEMRSADSMSLSLILYKVVHKKASFLEKPRLKSEIRRPGVVRGEGRQAERLDNKANINLQ